MASKSQLLILTRGDFDDGLVLLPPGVIPWARRRRPSENSSGGIEDYMLDYLDDDLIDALLEAKLAVAGSRMMGDDTLHIPEAGRSEVIAIAKAHGFRIRQLAP
jgi:hypothetical protein